MPYLFENRLNSIKDDIKEYFRKTLKLHKKTSSLICNYDYDVLVSVSNECEKLDIEGFELERNCIKFIAMEQPLANDLMYVESVIRILSHIKRINHLCKNIAESSKEILEFDCSMGILLDLNNMALKVDELLFNGFGAFYTQDVIIARKLDNDDDEIDDLFDSVLAQSTELLSHKTDNTNSIINILFIARFLERIADRVVSIGERVIFINTHKRPKIEKLKEDNSYSS